MKYRRLNEAELKDLEQDFIRFLASNQVTADDWKKLKDSKSDQADGLIGLFSDQVFDKVYPSHHLHKIKPDLSFYKSILSSESVSPNEVFFTDDLEKNVLAGKQVGINSFLYTGADNLRKQIASIED